MAGPPTDPPGLNKGPNITPEQWAAVRDILNLASSDNQFADKAYRAIQEIILTGNKPKLP